MLTELSLSLCPAASASGAARAAVRERFTGVLGRDSISDLELVISELVTNGVEHGRGSVRVDVAHSGHEISGSVSDDGTGFVYDPGPSRPRTARAGAGGRRRPRHTLGHPARQRARLVRNDARGELRSAPCRRNSEPSARMN
jgi:hypothetical protein